MWTAELHIGTMKMQDFYDTVPRPSSSQHSLSRTPLCGVSSFIYNKYIIKALILDLFSRVKKMFAPLLPISLRMDTGCRFIWYRRQERIGFE